ncbi:type II toxin-antitoxin system VapB family antitoxin [Myxococcota bacterium]|nr:type II toxin-antitoxin system VapB family antitoxin [Myxococcota bacterium]
MRTTLDLPEDLLRDLQRVTGAPTRREAVVVALEDFIRRQRLLRVAAAAGQLDFDVDPGELRATGARRLDG